MRETDLQNGFPVLLHSLLTLGRGPDLHCAMFHFFSGYFISLCACSALLTREDPICIAQYFSIKGWLELKNLSTPVTRTSADTILVGLLFVADVVVEALFRTASVETPTTINKSITNHHSQLLRRIPFFLHFGTRQFENPPGALCTASLPKW